MPTGKPKISNPGVHLMHLGLEEIHFKRGRTPVEGESFEPKVDLNLEVAQVEDSEGTPHLDAMSVGLRAAAQMESGAEFKVLYRGIFRRDEAATDPPEVFWKLVAARLAPMTLYPYVREAVAAVYARSALPPMTLPIVNAGGMWDPASIDVSAWLHDDAAEREAEPEGDGGSTSD